LGGRTQSKRTSQYRYILIDEVIAVVGNKIDRVDDEQVSYNEAKEYSQSIGAIFKLTSAKEGKGIGELFTSIAERLD